MNLPPAPEGGALFIHSLLPVSSGDVGRSIISLSKSIRKSLPPPARKPRPRTPQHQHPVIQPRPPRRERAIIPPRPAPPVPKPQQQPPPLLPPRRRTGRAPRLLLRLLLLPQPQRRRTRTRRKKRTRVRANNRNG